MRGRLIAAVLSTLAEEAATLLLALWVLPMFGIRIPLPVTGLIMAGWLAWSVVVYRKGSAALLRRPVRLTDMSGASGVVVEALKPDGIIKVEGELWNARSMSSEIEEGARVVVVRQEGLRLLVQRDQVSPGKSWRGRAGRHPPRSGPG